MARVIFLICFLHLSRQTAHSAEHPRDSGKAASFTIDVWQTEDGLPQNSVSAIAQTKDGYLWLGTFNGLVRFDGVRFTRFGPENTPELKSSRIIRLYLDPAGSLWIISESGDLARLQSGRFEAFNRKLEMPAEGAGMLSVDLTGRIWMRSYEGNTLQFRGERFVPVEPPAGITPGSFDIFLTDGEGGEWVLQDDRKIARRIGDRYERLKDPGGEEAYVPLAIKARDGGIWMTNGRELRRYHHGAWQEKRWTISSGERVSVFAMCEDRNGNVWLSTIGRGLLCCEPGGGVRNITTAEGLSHDSLRAIFEDSEGNLWVGTDGGGLNRLKPRLFSVYDTRDGLGGNIVMSVAEDREGNVWMGSNGGGLNRLRGGRISAMTNAPFTPTNRYVWSVLPSRDGSLWFGTWRRGLIHFQENKCDTYTMKDGLAGDKSLVLFEDGRGTLWAGGPGGVSWLENGVFHSYTKENGLSGGEVRALAEDQENNLYIGTDGGLDRLSGGILRHFGPRQGLASEQIRGLYVDKENALWIGTAAGLSLFQNGKFFNYKASDGLRTKSVGGILEDDLNYLWLMADEGIVRVSRAQLMDFAAGKIQAINCFSYDKPDGMGSGESSGAGRVQPAAWKTRDGRLWFGTVKGVSVVDPREVVPHPEMPPVFIEEVLVDDKVRRMLIGASSNDSLPGGGVGAVRMVPGDERVEFHYTALSLTTPKRARFKYQLEGLDRDWVDAGTRRVAYYNHLTPGDYRFRVIACNNDGVWNETGATIGMVVLPHVWQTWWFRVLAMVGVAGLILLIYERRMAQLKGQRLAQEDFARRLIRSQEQDRKRIAGELHDSLGQNLLVIKNRADLGLGPSKSAENASDQLREISSTAIQAIQEVRDIAQNLRPYQIDELGITAAIRSNIARVARSTSINFESEIANIDGLLSAEFEINLFRIVQEILNNIVKHAEASGVEFRLEARGGAIFVGVHDNGGGFDPEQQGVAAEGFGLRGLSERARLMGGECGIESQPGRGTMVTVMIPIPPKKND